MNAQYIYFFGNISEKVCRHIIDDYQPNDYENFRQLLQFSRTSMVDFTSLMLDRSTNNIHSVKSDNKEYKLR